MTNFLRHNLCVTVITECYEKMRELELLNKRACDILDCRIEAVLEEMSLTPLCDIPEDSAVNVEEFLRITEETCSEAAVVLAKYVFPNFVYEIVLFLESNYQITLK